MKRVMPTMGCGLILLALSGAATAHAADLFDAIPGGCDKAGPESAQSAGGTVAKDAAPAGNGTSDTKINVESTITYGVMTRFGNRPFPGHYGDAGRFSDVDLQVSAEVR